MKLLGFLIPPWAWAALAAVALSGAFYSGWKVQGWRCEAAQADALRGAQKRFQAQLDKQQAEAEEYEAQREQERRASVDREERIRTVYRDRVVPAECEPDPVAVSVLNDALDAANARAAGQPES